MEPQVEVYYKKDKEGKKDCSCLWVIVTVVAVALSFFVGILVSALTGIITTIGQGAIIALVILLSILLIIAIINVICCNKGNRKCKR